MELSGLPLVGLTAPALLGLTVLLLLTGRIVPRSTLDDKSRESDQWRQAYLDEREARGEAARQTYELLEVSKTTHAVTVALFDLVRETNRQSGGTSDVPGAKS